MLILSNSSSIRFNDESALSRLFIVRYWVPGTGRKIQYHLGSREPMPLGV